MYKPKYSMEHARYNGRMIYHSYKLNGSIVYSIDCMEWYNNVLDVCKLIDRLVEREMVYNLILGAR
jgi:hypothetical protein